MLYFYVKYRNKKITSHHNIKMSRKEAVRIEFSKKNNLKIIFFLNTLLFHISIKFFQNLKKELNSVGTLPMDWFYKEK